MFPDTMAMTINTENDFDDLADKLELKPLLDLPL